VCQSPCGARCANPRAVHGVPIPVRLLTTMTNDQLTWIDIPEGTLREMFPPVQISEQPNTPPAGHDVAFVGVNQG
jgi:hypothetical protein